MNFPRMQQWGSFFRSNWAFDWASRLSVCRPVDPDCCTLFCGFMSEVIWAGALPWPPHLHLAERRSGSLHLAQRFSDLISGDVRKAGDLGLTLQRMVFVLKGFTLGVEKRGWLLAQQLRSRLCYDHPAGPSAHNISVCVRTSV